MLLGTQIFTVRGKSICKEKNKHKLKDGKESDAVVLNLNWMDFPGSAVHKNPLTTGLIPGQGRLRKPGSS